MSNYRILAPEATTNLIINPSIETNTTGYTAMAGAIDRVSTQAFVGTYSLECTPAAGVNDGCYYGTVALTSGTTYSFSFEFMGGTVGAIYRAYFATTAGNIQGTPYYFYAPAAWGLVTVTWTADATTDFRLYVTKSNHSSVTPFYIDALRLEAKDHHTSYCDGSLALSTVDLQAGFVDDGVAWTGAAHASTSTRTATSRRGGIWYDLDTDLHFVVESVLGLGAPPVQLARVQYANPATPGALHEHSHEMERVIILNGIIVADSLANLDTYRSNLAYYMRPNSGAAAEGDEPFWLKYAGGAVNREIAAHYEGGLEGGAREGFCERVALRLIAVYPTWTVSATSPR